VLFRDMVVRESNIPRWGVLLGMLRRLEDRGEVRGGRFVSGFSGEQFALAEAAESLSAMRSNGEHPAITLSAADPLNMVGTLIPGERVPAIPGRTFVYADQPELTSATSVGRLDAPRKRAFAPRAAPPSLVVREETLRLF
jgi:ATP-dependent Lhr-like helicase